MNAQETLLGNYISAPTEKDLIMPASPPQCSVVFDGAEEPQVWTLDYFPRKRVSLAVPCVVKNLFIPMTDDAARSCVARTDRTARKYGWQTPSSSHVYDQRHPLVVTPFDYAGRRADGGWFDAITMRVGTCDLDEATTTGDFPEISRLLEREDMRMYVVRAMAVALAAMQGDPLPTAHLDLSQRNVRLSECHGRLRVYLIDWEVGLGDCGRGRPLNVQLYAWSPSMERSFAAARTKLDCLALVPYLAWALEPRDGALAPFKFRRHESLCGDSFVDTIACIRKERARSEAMKRLLQQIDQVLIAIRGDNLMPEDVPDAAAFVGALVTETYTRRIVRLGFGQQCSAP